MARKLASTEPVWVPEVPALTPLAADTRADVCLVGAGIAGLTTAYLLALQGQSVVVLEQQGIGAGETGRTTAHLTSVLDERYKSLRSIHGEKNAALAAASHTAAIRLVESVVQAESLDCGFERVDGYLVGGSSTESIRELEEELEASRSAGLKVELVPGAPVVLDEGPALHYPDQAQVHPLRYLAGLARAIRHRGGSIVRARAVDLDADDKGALVKTEGGPAVRANAVVSAAHAPFQQGIGLHLKQVPYRTYVIGVRVSRGSIPVALYWDTGDPYHYVRVVTEANGGDVLLVGGEDHKTGTEEDADERFARLETWTRERVSTVVETKFRWSGQVLEPGDGLAFIGRSGGSAKTVFVATGFSGNGITYGTLAGRLLSDLVTKGASEWEELYDPSRMRVKAAGQYLKDGLAAAAHYGEHATPGEVSSVADIPLGEGAVVRRGLAKVAVFRDDSGVAHEISARCTHMGCVVHWNPAEKSWDCPCHGSRFTPEGAVLNGPALEPLAALDAEKEQTC
jgi:glycine/D-amino acid oxidase-like deaminating enzyme